MPLELAREMAKHYQTLADWMNRQATALESGECQILQGGNDVSKDSAADLRHRANNIAAMIVGFERIAAREELRGLTTANTGNPGPFPDRDVRA